MSQGNVELARRALEAVRSSDHEAAERCFAVDVVWQNTGEFPGQRTCVGPRAIIDFWEALTESFEERGVEVERVVEGADSVVLGMHSVGRGKASGVPIDVHWGIAFHLSGGKVARVFVHGDWQNALRAGGLAEGT
jgi:ketosteroid isomerase-like protein